jgi:protoporphyrin/coproporphyrin ferrochelatase
MNKEKIGYLLINLGTPASPQPEDVRVYLDQFLMDPEVIDIPFFIRWMLVKLFILKDRPFQSAAQYKTIWTEKGSPLFYHTRELTDKVARGFAGEAEVEMAMRYGSPSIEKGCESLLKKQVTKIVVCPLYPQYSLAATESSLTAVRQVIQRLRNPVPVESVNAFYAEEPYLEAVARVSRKYLSHHPYDMAVFSFHGVPERQVKKTDKTGSHCLQAKECSLSIVEANANCYRAQCYYTARKVAEKLGIPESHYRVAFQSRLGRTPWIKPYSDELYRELPKLGAKKVVVFCPSFVADCLETLEEVTVRGEEEFRLHGGEKLTLIPSLNSEPDWVQAVVELLKSAPRQALA